MYQTIGQGPAQLRKLSRRVKLEVVHLTLNYGFFFWVKGTFGFSMKCSHVVNMLADKRALRISYALFSCGKRYRHFFGVPSVCLYRVLLF